MKYMNLRQKRLKNEKQVGILCIPFFKWFYIKVPAFLFLCFSALNFSFVSVSLTLFQV